MIKSSDKGSRLAPTVVGTGLVALDIVYDDDRPPQYWAGGTCGNVLAILSYLGWQAFPVARLDQDIAGRIVLADLAQCGVRVEFATTGPVAATPIVVHQIRRNSDGAAVHTYSFRCPSCGTDFPRYRAVWSRTALDVTAGVSEAAVFFFDRPSRAAVSLAQEYRRHGALIVFEPSGGGDRRLLNEALALTHVLKYASDRAYLIRAIEHRPLLEIETFGANGLRFRRATGDAPGEWSTVPAVRTEVVRDTAGAGDWCTAGLIFAIGAGAADGFCTTTDDQLMEALHFGQALAAWNCSFPGARGGIYSTSHASFRAQIEAVLRTGSSTPELFGSPPPNGEWPISVCEVCAVSQWPRAIPKSNGFALIQE